MTADYKELTYEGYGHGGVGFVVNVSSTCFKPFPTLPRPQTAPSRFRP